MEILGNWYSELGFVIEIENDSLTVSGVFYKNSTKTPFKGVYINSTDKLEVSFIIIWETNTKTSTVFTGKLLDEASLSLDWLLFLEDEATSKINTFQGNVVLKKYPIEPTISASTQDKLPYPKTLTLYNQFSNLDFNFKVV